MNPDGTSRCSVRLSAAVVPTTHASSRRFEVLLPGARVAARNDLHPLETEFFNSPLLRVRLERRGSSLALVLTLRADVTPTMRVETVPEGGQLVVVDLPAGSYVQDAPTLGGASVRPSDARSEPPPDRAAPVRPSAAAAPAPAPAAAAPSTSAPSNASSSPAPSTGAAATSPSARPAPARTSHDDEERPPAFR